MISVRMKMICWPFVSHLNCKQAVSYVTYYLLVLKLNSCIHTPIHTHTHTHTHTHDTHTHDTHTHDTHIHTHNPDAGISRLFQRFCPSGIPWDEPSCGDRWCQVHILLLNCEWGLLGNTVSRKCHKASNPPYYRLRYNWKSKPVRQVVPGFIVLIDIIPLFV